MLEKAENAGVYHEATVFLARGKLSFFEEGLNVDKELPHGRDDGAFVGLAAIAKAFDIWGDAGAGANVG